MNLLSSLNFEHNNKITKNNTFWICQAEYASNGSKLYRIVRPTQVHIKLDIHFPGVVYYEDITDMKGRTVNCGSNIFVSETYNECVVYFNTQIRKAIDHANDIIAYHERNIEKYSNYFIPVEDEEDK